jgi:predicted membrane channel-forming protein YqfA (hemolysin III family)
MLALIGVIVAICLLCWALTRLNPQPPVSWIIYGIIALLCLVVIWHFIGGSVGMGHL